MSDTEPDRKLVYTRVDAWLNAMAQDFGVSRCTQSVDNGRRMRNNEVYKRRHNAGISETTSGLTTDYRQMRFSPRQIRALPTARDHPRVFSSRSIPSTRGAREPQLPLAISCFVSELLH